MQQNATKLTPRQERAALMLVAVYPEEEILRELKICRATLYRWKKRRDFQEFSRKALEKIHADLHLQLANMAETAALTVTQQLSNSMFLGNRERATIALDVLKFLKADQILVKPAINQLETKND